MWPNKTEQSESTPEYTNCIRGKIRSSSSKGQGWAGLWDLWDSDEKNYDRRDERKKNMGGRRRGATRRLRVER